jgi:hypothetical protein
MRCCCREGVETDAETDVESDVAEDFQRCTG